MGGRSGYWEGAPDGHEPPTDADHYLQWDKYADVAEYRVKTARIISAAPDLLAVANAYAQWEADLVLSDKAWRGGLAPLPTLTQELWDRLLELQKMRNAAIAAAEGGS